MKHSRLGGLAVVTFVLFAGAGTAHAQRKWTGAHVSGQVGRGFQPEDSGELVRFDKNLDGDFGDTVTTAAGANAFSPGFCGGGALTSSPASGCTEDEDGVDFGLRAGYDWQFGRLVVGLAGEASTAKARDGVAAFSTTPAFYTFNRELNWLGAIRARAGYATERVLIY